MRSVPKRIEQKHRLLYVYEERIPQELRALLLDAIPREEFEVDSMTYLTPNEEKIRKLKWAEVVLFAPGRFLPDEILAHASHIKLMQLWSSGFEKFNVAGARKYAIPVANNGGANAISVAEHTVLLILAVYKWLPESHRRTVEGKWIGNNHGLDMFLMKGKKLGIIGFGTIGRRVAATVSGFGMDVLYFDVKRANPEIEQSLNARYISFDELIEESDIITLHLHAHDASKNIIGRKEFERMKKGAVLINVSRSELVDQDALREALHSRRIWGAGLDVHPKEPTEPGDPILTHPHVVATPHMAGSTRETYSLVLERAVENVRKAVSGEQPQWLVS
jgi:D-3-phosphoglycerate dehydrogenase